jgi:hypothetical protein
LKFLLSAAEAAEAPIPVLEVAVAGMSKAL